MTLDFSLWLRSLGLRPGVIVPDDKWRRCATESHPRKKNGAYKLAADGQIGWGRDWAQHEKPLTWRPEKQEKVDAEAEARTRRYAAEQARKRHLARRNASADARIYYENAQPLEGGHPYLDAHSLDMTGCRGLKVDEKGWLVIPAYRQDGTLGSIQRISPTGQKLFWKDAPITGTAYPILRHGAQITILCEGLATGLALYKCVPHSKVIVAWSTDNLASTDWRVSGMAVVAADNDHGTEERRGFNPGIKAARKAAEKLGIEVVYPEGIAGTDWADYLEERTTYHAARLGRFEHESVAVRNAESEIRRRVLQASKMVQR